MKTFWDYPNQTARMEIPSWAEAAGFEDFSCHNDERARMRHENASDLNLWIGDEMDNPRYVLAIEHWTDNVCDETTWVISNDPHDVLRFLENPPARFTEQLEAAMMRDQERADKILAGEVPGQGGAL
jgi:hypothetical protein